MSIPKSTPPNDGNMIKGIFGLLVLFLLIRACSSSNDKPAESLANVAPAADSIAIPDTPQLPAVTGAALTAEAKKIEGTLEPYKPPEATPATLTVRSWNWREEYSYAIVEGTVKNNSGEAIENLEAVVEFTDGAGNLIKSGSALVDFRPLMPGQSSPFKVMESFNPMIKSASLRFKQLMGGEIAYDQSKKLNKRPESPFVYNIQLNLMNMKFTEAAADGVMGEGTRKAIRAFEKAYGLPITGQASKFVYAATEVACKRKPLPAE